MGASSTISKDTLSALVSAIPFRTSVIAIETESDASRVKLLFQSITSSAVSVPAGTTISNTVVSKRLAEPPDTVTSTVTGLVVWADKLTVNVTYSCCSSILTMFVASETKGVIGITVVSA